MKAITFDLNDKVVTIIGGELRKGIVKNIFPLNPPVCIIKFEDGNVMKVPCSNVMPEPKETVAQKNKPVEKSEITITPDEFREISCRVIAEETKEYKLLGLAFAPILGKIHRALFVDSSEDENFLN